MGLQSLEENHPLSATTRDGTAAQATPTGGRSPKVAMAYEAKMAWRAVRTSAASTCNTLKESAGF